MDIQLSQIRESKLNPRTFYENLTEMADSIKRQGVISPITVREVEATAGSKEDRYEIVVGHRRFRASKLAGLQKIPAIKATLTDAEVLEIMCVENHHRDDIHPLDEGEGYKRLLAFDGYTHESIADKCATTIGFVYKRIQLTRLIAPLKEAYRARRFGLGHAAQLCRLPDAKQVEVDKDGLWDEDRSFNQKSGKWETPPKAKRKVVDLRELVNLLDREFYLSLKGVPWSMNDAELLPAAGACDVCPKRTGANLHLFDDAGKGDRCLDGTCFAKKQAAFVKLQAAAKPELPRIALTWTDDKELKKAGVNLRYADLTAVRKGEECASQREALVVLGKETGHTVMICTDKTCKVHHRRGSSFNAGKPDKAQQKRQAEIKLESQIDAAYQLALYKAVAGLEASVAFSAAEYAAHLAMTESMGYDSAKLVCEVFGIESSNNLFHDVATFVKALMIADDRAQLDRLHIVICMTKLDEKERNLVADACHLKTAAIKKAVAEPLQLKHKKKFVDSVKKAKGKK